MNAHTPGPWSVNSWPQADCEIRVGAAGTPRIATVHLRDTSINSQRANAALIAAAPDTAAERDRLRAVNADLLAALRDLLAAASLGAARDVPFAINSPGIVAARAAIARAEGRS